MKMSEKARLTIVIVSYNTREMTLDCLTSIYAETRETPFHVVVLDNMSNDGSPDAIAEAFPQAQLIRSPKNLGFARGNNAAVSQTESELVLLLNPDTVVLDGAIDTLVAFANDNPRAMIWGGRTLFGDRTLNPSSCWRRMTVWNLFCRSTGLAAVFLQSPVFHSEAYGGWSRDTVREVDIVTGCFLLITRKFWDELGGFDGAFFMYGEDADLCLRASACGARPMITPKATIVHYSGASETVLAHKMMRLLTAKISLIKRHWSPPTQSLGVALFRLGPFLRWFVYSTAARLTNRYADAARTWREIWGSRRTWQNGFV